MKKVLLLSIGLIYSAAVSAQTNPSLITAKEMMEDASFEEEFPLLDMKVFHDRLIMKEIVRNMYAIEQNPFAMDEEMLKKTPVDGTDVQTVNDSLKSKVNYGLTQKPLNERLQKADEQPFEAFKDLIMGTSIPQMSPDEIKTRVKPDDAAKMMQMLTESGAGIGAGQVSVIHSDET